MQRITTHSKCVYGRDERKQSNKMRSDLLNFHRQFSLVLQVSTRHISSNIVEVFFKKEFFLHTGVYKRLQVVDSFQ